MILKGNLAKKLTFLDLNLYANKLGPKGALALAPAISNLSQIQHFNLDLYFNNITEIGAEALGKAFNSI